MYGWVMLTAGYHAKRHSIELEVSLFDWNWRVLSKPEKGLRLAHIGPVCITLWDTEKANEWLSNKISEVMDVEREDAES
jgi:hypothetical protein